MIRDLSERLRAIYQSATCSAHIFSNLTEIKKYDIGKESITCNVFQFPCKELLKVILCFFSLLKITER